MRPASAPPRRGQPSSPPRAPRSLSAKLLRAHSNSEFDEKRLKRLLAAKLKQHEREAKALAAAALHQACLRGEKKASCQRAISLLRTRQLEPASPDEVAVKADTP